MHVVVAGEREIKAIPCCLQKITWVDEVYWFVVCAIVHSTSVTNLGVEVGIWKIAFNCVQCTNSVAVMRTKLDRSG